MKMKNRSRRCDRNRPRSGHEHKHNKSKKGLSIIMVICIKQQLSNLCSSFVKKLSKTEVEFKKKRYL